MKKELRQANYRKLRDCGFNSYDANFYKEYKPYVVDQLCDAKKRMTTLLHKQVQHILKGR
jgi:hypothetical protein